MAYSLLSLLKIEESNCQSYMVISLSTPAAYLVFINKQSFMKM